MPTTLAVGDIAIVHYNSEADTFSFVFLRDVEAGTAVNFTDNGWLAAGGFRGGESTVTYTAPTAITAGTIVTLSGLDLDAAGDQIIAYQGGSASPTILHLVDLADSNNTVAGDATDAATTALPPGFTLGVNAVAIAFDDAIYAGPVNGSPAQLFAAANNFANWIDAETLPVPFKSQDRPDIDLDADNSTKGGRDYDTTIASGGPATPIADTDIDISDDDGTEIFAAEIKVNGKDPEDLLTVIGTLPGGITATAYDPATGILRLDGQASHADYEAAIRLIHFSTTDAPNNLKRIEVTVFDGDEWSPEGAAFIHIKGTATATDPPVLDLDANNSSGGGADATATFTAGGPAIPIADVDVSIADADSTMLESATITIGVNRQSDDVLSIVGTLPSGITASSYDADTGVITLNGTASLADYQTALRQVAYSSTNPTPFTADRMIEATVSDGTLISNVGTMYMHVAGPPPNAAPVLDLDANNSTAGGSGYSTTFTTGGAEVAIVDDDISIADSDDAIVEFATITLTNPAAGDSLTVVMPPALPAGITVTAYDPGTGVLQLTGAASLADYQTALQQVVFNSSSSSTVTRIIDVVVNDGVADSNVAQTVIDVSEGNANAPALDLDADNSTAPLRGHFAIFTENGPAVAIADVDTLITDVDSTELASATITLKNPKADDVLSVLGGLPATITATSYDPGTGVLTLSGVASLADYETALEAIRFSSTGDDPVGGLRIIEVVLNDGVNQSQAAISLVSVQTEDDAPTLNLVGSTYVEDSAPSLLAPLANLTDDDSTNLTAGVVRITDGSFAGDGDVLTVGGLTSGTVGTVTFAWNPALHAMVLTGLATVADYRALLRSVEYQSASDNPTNFGANPGRALIWAVSDGVAVSTTTTNLDIVAVNDAPETVNLLAAVSYTENAAPVLISPTSTLTDVDDVNLVAGQFRIVAGAVDGDLLTVNGLQSGTFSGIDFSSDATTHSLTFTRPTTVADYQAFVQAIGFSSTSDDPTNGGLSPTRTVSWAVTDGDVISNIQTIDVSIAALADPPINTLPGTQSVNANATLPIAGVSVADVDSPTLTTTLAVLSGTLSVTAGPGVSNNGTASVTITGTAAEINAALGDLSYTGNLNFKGFDRLTVTTDDGTTPPDVDWVALTVGDARPILDLDSDNSSGAFDKDYLSFVTAGGPAVPISDFDVDVDDFDDSDLLAAEIRIFFADPDDLLAIDGLLPFGIVAEAYNPLTGILRLNGLAFHDDYEAAIREVVFSTADDAGFTKIIGVSVFDGSSWSQDTQAFIRVVRGGINDPPALDLDANNSSSFGNDASATYEAGGPAVSVVDTDVLITDDGTTITSAKVNILDYSLRPGDVLSISGTLPAGITASGYNPFNGEITLSGSASLADYQTALRQVVFSNTLGTPSTVNRDIQVTINDGTSDSNIATMHMHVVIPPPNATPILDLDANNSTTTGTSYLTGFTEGGLPVAIVDADVLAIDSDGPNLASATITLTNPQIDDVLIFEGTAPGSIIVSGSGTSVVTLTGAASSGDYELALQQIRFDNSNIDPSNITRTIEVVVNDGTINSNIATALVQVEAVNNSAPAVDLDPNDSSFGTRTTFRTIFTENGPPTAIADIDTSIIDLDSTTLVSATITLVNQTSFDELSVTLPLPGGIVASAYDPVTGVLTLTGIALLDDYELALQQVFYSNNNDNPNTQDRLIEVVVSDGVNTSNVAAAVITVVTTNDPPVVEFEGAVYVEGASIVTLDPIAAVTDPDNADLSQVVIRISSGAQPGDFLTIGGATGGTINGIFFTYDAGEHAMVLTGASSIANYQNLLRTAGFHTFSDNPTNFGADAIRILTWSISDGTAVTSTTTTLDILAVNDAPEATVAATAAYTENAAPVVISPASTVADVDNLSLIAGEVRIIAGAVDGDLLTVGGLQSGTFLGIEFSYDPLQHSLTFTHPTLVADYQAFLQAIEFSSTSDNPTNFGLSPTRTLSWFVFDGEALNDEQTTVVTITALADAPVNTVPAAQSVNEDTLLAIAGVSVADADSPTLTTRLTVASGKLTATPGPGVTGNDTATVAITGTLVEINTALAGLSYTGNLDFNGLDTLTVTTDDGTAQDIDTIAITINPVNDPPVNTVPGPQSVNEDATLAIAGVTVADPDVGPITTTLTVTSGTLNVAAGPGVAGNGTSSVIITGTVTVINTALAGLTYTGNLNFNGSDSLTVTTSDGAATDIDAVAIAVPAVNDPPVNTVPGAQSVNEDANRSMAGLAIADVDAGAGTLTATLSVTHGTLTVASAGGAGVSGSGTASVTLTGTVSQINTTLAAASNVVYRGAADYNGPDALTVTTSDGGNTGSGGASADIDTVAITVSAVNDRPVLDLDADNSSGAAGADYTTTFVEGGTAVAVSDVDDLIADVDNSNLAFATVTLANHQPADMLSITGTLPAGIVASAYDPATGVLTLSGAATLAAYQTALRQIVFSNSSPTPSATDRIVNTVVSDGAAGSVAAHAFVHVLAVDTAPALDLDADNSSGAAGADYTAVFSGGGAAVPIADADALIVDADSPNLVSATIRLTNGQPTDLLSVNGTLPTGIASAFDPLTGILTLTGSASRADYQTALHQIEYGSSVPNPLTATRIIEVVVNDGGTDSNAAFSQIRIALPAPPTLDLDADDSTIGGSDYATAFHEDGAPVRIADTDIAISTSTLVRATITLTNLLPGDLLSVTGTLPAGITHVYDPVTGVLTLTGEASAAAYQTASDLIVYSNNSDNPPTDDRIITVVVNDGINDSNTATAIAKITAVNDPPSLSVSAVASYTENDPAVLVSPAVTVSDPDSPNLTIAIAAITAGLSPGDVLTVGGLRSGRIGSITFDWAPALNELIVTGAGSPADYETLFQSVRFHSDSDDPTNGGADATRTVSWAVFDGAKTAIATTTLTIAAVNDAPVLAGVAASAAFTAGGPATTLSPALTTADADNPGLAAATVSITAGLLAGDLLAATTTGTAIAASYDSASGILTLTGPDTLAHYQQVLDSVSYQSTAVNPTNSGLNPTRTIAWQVNDGEPADNLSLTQITTVTLTDAPTVPSEVSGDFNGDFNPNDRSDILWRADNGEVSTWDMENAGAAEAYHVLGVVPATSQIHGAGDFNGDGKSDLLWRADNGEVSVWEMASAGEVQADHNLGVIPASSHIRGTGDFSGDGKSDILWRADNGEVSIWEMANAGAAAAYHVLGVVPATSDIQGIGDFNGDGKSDILWRADNGEVSIWEMKNAGEVAAYHVLGVIPTTSHILGTGDFNGDGRSDILWRADNGEVSTWEMANAGQVQAYHVLDVVPTTSHVRGTGDYSGDGKSDILWRADNGEVSTWEMANAGQVQGYHVLGVIQAISHIQHAGQFDLA